MTPHFSADKLAELLVEEKKVDAEKLKELMPLARKEKKTVLQLITEKEMMKDDEMIDFMSNHLGIPLLNLPAYRIPKEIIKSFPAKIAERYRVIPLSRIKKLVTLATSNPFDLMLKDDIKGLLSCDVALVLAPPKMISGLIEQYYSESANLDEIIEGIDEDSLEVIKEDNKDEDKGSGGKIDNAPVVRMVNVILDGALKSRASDIHFEPYEKEFRVRYRIDGALHESFAHAKDVYPAVVARVKIISQLDITEKRVPQDGRFRIKVHNTEVDFRVSILPTYFGEKMVLRVLDKSGLKSGLDKLGFTERPTSRIAEIIKHPYGMMLVTGPTGSGKSTTLYTILGTLNTADRNIMTIEDPVEYQVEGISQTGVIPEVGLTFAAGLRSLLRQSPDIVLVGEIRDGETADIAVKAALTGHLVFSTLHTNSAAGAVTRLIDMGVEPFLIASSLVGVAAQRLMKKICQFCKAPCEVPEDVMRRCHMKPEDMKDIKSFKGKGCAKCNNTGYYGRLGTTEVLTIDNEIRELIIQRKSSNVIHEAAVKKGMETLFENAFSLFKLGQTTMEEVLRVTASDH
ncbi:MAG TPA: ATPase, T2SS/T4P/T4SS family [Verrucomicrobiae bacterium]|jgi:type IV pilus assembly protein PilB|nr:ATPase, T2SS/T4P/T4SS family [Verrucomicrobiae bacterium]